MEFILVNSVKLKIILSDEDMKALRVTPSSLDYASAETRAALEKILERARLSTGFDSSHARLVVRAFPSKDGGCELFLTKKSRLLPEPEENRKTACKKSRLSERTDKRGKKEYLAVGAFDPLADLCVRLHTEGFYGRSALYLRHDRYYLHLAPEPRDPFSVESEEELDRYFFLGEYADVFFADAIRLAHLAERGNCLIREGAVERLAAAFEKQTEI